MHDNSFQIYSLFLLSCMMEIQSSSKTESCTLSWNSDIGSESTSLSASRNRSLQKQFCYFVLTVCIGGFITQSINRFRERDWLHFVVFKQTTLSDAFHYYLSVCDQQWDSLLRLLMVSYAGSSSIITQQKKKILWFSSEKQAKSSTFVFI